MKDIGAKFKIKREEMGVTLEEVSNDLNVTIAQLENLEDGSAAAFKDIFFLKELVKKYTTYLNLDENEIMEEFNDFVFNYTSKIPIEEIEQKVKEITKDEEKEIKKNIFSPYTQKKVKKIKLKPVYLYIAVTTILVMITILILKAVIGKAENNNLMNFVGGINYEFTK